MPSMNTNVQGNNAFDPNVGCVRPSQLLWSYGPGAMIDLPNISVMTKGLEAWKQEECVPISEHRLLTQVRRLLGNQVDKLLMPPVQKEEGQAGVFGADASRGAPVLPFPRWLRCTKCQKLSPYDDGLFKVKVNKFRPEHTRYVHEGCLKAHGHRPSDVVPARFLVACECGHVDEFPWHWYVHGGPSNCKGELKFYEQGASLQTDNLWVECSCGAKRSMAQAFGKDGAKNLPACRGRHPHLGTFEECKAAPRTILLGATNSWFPTTVSVLAIPTAENELAQLVHDNMGLFVDVESVEELKIYLKAWKASGQNLAFMKYDAQKIWDAYQKEKNGEGGGANEITEADVKIPEWNALMSEEPIGKWPEFCSKRVEIPSEFKDVLADVLLLERLRKVNALVGFTRIEALDEFADEEAKKKRAPLSRHKPTWVPACEVYGEGIYIRFKEEVISAWENSDAVKKRAAILKKGYEGWRAKRGQDPHKGFPGARYYMLHTLAHFIIRELALTCGYNAASIQERLYGTTDTLPMAGILIYTAASDSDGTLGGLVELGQKERLGPILKTALDRAKICSSDPLCAQHRPDDDCSLHGTACHACAFAAETSCEVGNRYLDRALVVPTYDCADAAFFKETP